MITYLNENMYVYIDWFRGQLTWTGRDVLSPFCTFIKSSGWPTHAPRVVWRVLSEGENWTYLNRLDAMGGQLHWLFWWKWKRNSSNRAWLENNNNHIPVDANCSGRYSSSHLLLPSCCVFRPWSPSILIFCHGATYVAKSSAAVVLCLPSMVSIYPKSSAMAWYMLPDPLLPLCSVFRPSVYGLRRL